MKQYLYSCLVGLAVLTSCRLKVFKVADLRPEESRELKLDSIKGSQLLQQMAVAHGIETWKTVATYTIGFEDEFYGFMGKQANPFDTDKISFTLNYIAGTFDGRLDFYLATKAKNSWGIQDWNTYEIKQSELKFKKKSDITFWLPTYQYFIEFPIRIQSATAMSYVGDRVVDGQGCNGVIVSWNTVEPQRKTDQYLVWLSKETHRIVKLEYTIREEYKFLTGAVLYKNYVDYNGLILPTSLPVETNLLKEGELLHTMRIKSFTPNSISKKELRPGSDLKKVEKK